MNISRRSVICLENEKRLMCCFRHLTVPFACFTLVLPVWAWGQCFCGAGSDGQGCGRGTAKPGCCCSHDEVGGGTSCPLSFQLMILKLPKNKNVILIFLIIKPIQKLKNFTEQSFLLLQVLPLTLNQMLILSLIHI